MIHITSQNNKLFPTLADINRMTQSKNIKLCKGDSCFYWEGMNPQTTQKLKKTNAVVLVNTTKDLSLREWAEKANMIIEQIGGEDEMS